MIGIFQINFLKIICEIIKLIIIGMSLMELRKQKKKLQKRIQLKILLLKLKRQSCHGKKISSTTKKHTAGLSAFSPKLVLTCKPTAGVSFAVVWCSCGGLCSQAITNNTSYTSHQLYQSILPVSSYHSNKIILIKP